MPYTPERQPPRAPLTDAERERKIKEVQQEQERRLREVLADDLYEWLEAFEGDLDVLCQD